MKRNLAMRSGLFGEYGEPDKPAEVNGASAALTSAVVVTAVPHGPSLSPSP